MSNIYRIKYIKYKEKYLQRKKMMNQVGGEYDIQDNVKITNYLRKLDLCHPYFGTNQFKNLKGRDPSSSGAYITTGKVKIDNILHGVVIKFFINDCPYKYRKKTVTRSDNNTYEFQSRNEIGTMDVLTDLVLLKNCTPNITWFYKGGVCKNSHPLAIKCRKEKSINDTYLFQEGDYKQDNEFSKQVVTKLLENVNEENAVYEAITHDSYIPYMIVEKCGLSYAGYLNNITTEQQNLNNILKTAIMQILITLKILRSMFQSNEYVEIPISQVYDGCYVEYNNQKIEILHIFNDINIWKMILINNEIIQHNDTNKYYKKPAFMHNDCHIGNILTQSIEGDSILLYELKFANENKQIFYVPHNGYIAKLWDFDTSDIVYWQQLQNKYYSYYKDVSRSKIGVRFINDEDVIINDVYTLFDTFLNGKVGSFSGISKTMNCEISIFLRECLKLGKRIDFIKLLIDKDISYIDAIEKTSYSRVRNVCNYFDEYRKNSSEKQTINFLFNEKIHSMI